MTVTIPTVDLTASTAPVGDLLREAAGHLSGVSADTLLRAAAEHDEHGCPASAVGIPCRHEDIARAVLVGPDWAVQVA
jgi:hypothetical protein